MYRKTAGTFNPPKDTSQERSHRLSASRIAARLYGQSATWGINGRPFNLGGKDGDVPEQLEGTITQYQMDRSQTEASFDPSMIKGFDTGSVPSVISRVNPLLKLSQAELDTFSHSVSSSSLEDGSETSFHKIDVIDMDKKGYWFKNQRDRDDSIIETRAEVFCDDFSEGTSSRVLRVEEPRTSFS